ncbi:UPF0262 family protein [Bauldia sp.]|uniref:UPF0262 family protein n=1 Tax=Bauldia sp. TaxID=2575872 RepID=UPI003BAA4EFC
MPTPTAPPPAGLVAVDIDAASFDGAGGFLEAERTAAVRDLLAQNRFEPGGRTGTFRLKMAVVEQKLVLDVSDDGAAPLARHILSLRPLSRVIRDYFIVCESYREAVDQASPARIEAIDMGRRGLHDEGATVLRDRLAGKIEMDHATARRLFTLVCALNWRIRGQR